ncbi:uncharacterized protein KD926_005868 [Aspergillus affinis]|uniref:uncharacterized protein n=1 Tax=Aspergillus affinis TaxID=1070780 RepID=UPI0022FED012|nr:uncharacterized protein KD926_005868 [Aspergillus affinis]KAI9045925.1 hypothetical protein KD926_005868 [Aspergillus affinis]
MIGNFSRLRLDAFWWLRRSEGQVKLVILISIHRSRPEILVEKWINGLPVHNHDLRPHSPSPSNVSPANHLRLPGGLVAENTHPRHTGHLAIVRGGRTAFFTAIPANLSPPNRYGILNGDTDWNVVARDLTLAYGLRVRKSEEDFDTESATAQQPAVNPNVAAPQPANNLGWFKLTLQAAGFVDNLDPQTSTLGMASLHPSSEVCTATLINGANLRTSLPFSRGLPPLKILQIPTITSVLKEAIARDGLYQSRFLNKSEKLQKALQNILANGWLHAENSDGDEQFIFASQIHRWYCQCLFSEKHSDNQLDYVTPLELALDTIRRFQPCQLAHAPRSLAGNSRPLEDQYQKEFYRCLFPLLDGHVVMSPEFVIQSDTKGGTIDFLLIQKKWGVELLRDRNRLQEHMNRFKPNGQYFTLIEKGKMDQYIVLNFTNILPRKSHPEFRDHLYHVVFSEEYQKVTVIDASDLCEVNTFVLMENTN